MASVCRHHFGLHSFCFLGRTREKRAVYSVLAECPDSTTGFPCARPIPSDLAVLLSDFRVRRSESPVLDAHTVLLQKNKQSPGLSTWLADLTARKRKQVATVAMANKMARMVWAVLTKGEAYRPPLLLEPARNGLQMSPA
jgi:hypothetical protein